MPEPGKEIQEGSMHYKKLEQIGANIATQKEVAKKARNRIEDIFDEKTQNLGGRAEFVENVIEDLLKEPIKDAEKEWTDTRDRIREDSLNQSLEGLVNRLRNETKPFADRIEEASGIAEAYIIRLTETSERGDITPEVIAQMAESQNARASVLMELLLRKGNEDLTEALKWVLLEPEDKGKKAGATKPEAPVDQKEKGTATLTKYLKKSPNYEGETMPFVWMIITLMRKADRVEFAKAYVTNEKLSEESTKKFLEAGNMNGTFSPAEMAEVSPAFDPAKLTEDQKRKYAETYRKLNDFAKQGKAIARICYGSSNQAGDLFKFGNIFGLGVQIVAGISAGANIFTSFYSGGEFKLKEGFEAMVTNENLAISLAALAGVHILKQKGHINDALEAKEERSAEERSKAQADLYRGVNANAGWQAFFSRNGDAGPKALWEFTKSMIVKDKIDPKRLTISEFVAWLKVESQKKQPSSPMYAQLLGLFKQTADGWQVAGNQTSDYELARFVGSFNVLGIADKNAYERHIAISAKPIGPTVAQAQGQAPSASPTKAS